MNKIPYKLVYRSNNFDKSITHQERFLLLDAVLAKVRFLSQFASIPRIEVWQGNRRLLLVVH